MKKYTKVVTFRAVRSSASGWTDVRVRAFNEKGELGDEVVINSFGGTDNGRPEAERFAKMLNDSVEKFHSGGES